MQMADEVPEGSGRLRFRWPMKFRMVPVQIAARVAEVSGAVSGAHSKQSSGAFRYKNFPKTSKLLGITHEFIEELGWKPSQT